MTKFNHLMIFSSSIFKVHDLQGKLILFCDCDYDDRLENFKFGQNV